MLSEDEFKIYALREKTYVPDPALESRMEALRIESADLSKSLAEAQDTENAETETLIANIRRLIATNQQEFAETVVKQWNHKWKHVSPERLEYYHGHSIKSELECQQIVSKELQRLEAEEAA